MAHSLDDRIAQRSSTAIYRLVAIVFVSILGILWGDGLGLFAEIDGIVYDACVRTQATYRPVRARVMLVYAKPVDMQSRVKLQRASSSLLKLGATRVVIIGTDTDVFSQTHSGVVLAPSVVPHRIKPATYELANSILVCPELTCVAGLPPMHSGVFREQSVQFPLQHETVPGFEAKIARELLGRKDVNFASFGVSYRGGAGSLPHVDIQSVLDDQLVADLVAERVVIIGTAASSVPVVTPTTSPGRHMTPLEYHGHALNTLLCERPILQFSRWMKWVILFVVGLGSLLVFARCRLHHSFFVAAGLLGSSVLATIAVFDVASMWLPLAPVIAVQFVSFYVTAREKASASHEHSNRILLDLSDRLRNRSWPNSFCDADDPWDLVVNLLQQTLNLNRLVILELPQGSHHLREKRAMNYSIGDIEEMRRDVRRWPYSEATQSNDVMHLEDRDRLFIADHPDEQQYLVPLQYHGETFGFWAFGLREEDVELFPDFESRVREYATEIAQLFYLRRERRRSIQTASKLYRLFTGTPEQNGFAAITRSLELLESRLSQLEFNFEHSQTPAVIYDLFGRCLMINETMSTLLADRNLDASEMSASEFIEANSNLAKQSTNQLLRRIIAMGKSETVTYTTSNGERSYLLNIRPIEVPLSQSSSLRHEPAPFQLTGLLCELVDRTSIIELYRLKDKLNQALGVTLRNDLTAMELGAALLSDDSVTIEEKVEVAGAIEEKVRSAVTVMDQCNDFLTKDMDEVADVCVPIDGCGMLDRTVSLAIPFAESRGIEINLQQPKVPGYILASPARLGKIFEALVDMIIQDARDRTEVIVDVAENEAETVIELRNDGFGTVHDQQDVSDALQSNGLLEARELLQSWGGSLEIDGVVGVGTTTTCKLKRFGYTGETHND